MPEILLHILIGLCLSLDAFSLCLSISDAHKKKLFPLYVGIFHFVMPLFGRIINTRILSLIIDVTNIIGGIILIYLAIKIILETYSKKRLTYNDYSLLYLALLVSLDSLSVGIGLGNTWNNIFLPPIVYSLVSGIITYIGIKVSNTLHKKNSNLANWLAIIILMVLGVVHLCK